MYILLYIKDALGIWKIIKISLRPSKTDFYYNKVNKNFIREYLVIKWQNFVRVILELKLKMSALLITQAVKFKKIYFTVVSHLQIHSYLHSAIPMQSSNG